MRTTKIIALTSILLTSVLATDVCAQARELFIATDGLDASPGTREEPLASLPGARDAIRAMKAAGGLPQGGVTVWLRGGTYHLDEPFELSKADSGTPAAPIAYRAYGGEEVWISGARAIDPSRFEPVSDAGALARLDEAARGKVLQVDLAAQGITDYERELPERFRGFTNVHPTLLEVFCNGKRMQPARWPNEGFAHFGDIVDFGSGLRDPKGPERPGVFKYEGERPSRWSVDEGVWLQGFWARAYLCTVVKVGAIDPQKHEIKLAVPLHYGLDTWGAKRFFATNVLEELDAPGEWYVDRRRGVLYFWPPAPIGECSVGVSMIKSPMIRLRDAEHVILRGLGVEACRQDAVSIQEGGHNRIIGCTIRNTGRHGVEVRGGVDHGIIGCDIHDTGYGGVMLYGGDRKTLTPANHFADNNHIHHTSVIRRTHAGPISLRGVGLRAGHNLIHHEPHSAVWYQGNDLLMEYNEIYMAHTETTEGGVFYTGRDWTTRGNVIRYNYIHHINDSLEGSPTSVNVVHEDDCSAGTTFYGNLCYRVGRGVSICGGPDNTVENNIFVDCKLGVGLSDRGLQWWEWTRHEDGSVTAIDTRNGREGSALLSSLRRVPYNRPPYTRYPHLADILERDPVGAPWFCRVVNNISVGGKALTVSRGVKDEWVTVQNNWEETDPGFVDLKNADFRLRDDAPVLEKGFKPLPLDEIGLINDETRASWPVNAEPAPQDWKPRWLVQREQEERMPTALPVFAVKPASAAIRIDGIVDLEEWTPGQAGGVVVEAYTPARLEATVQGDKTDHPSTAWLETDAEHLYVAFVNETNPAKGVTGGQVWGKDDAVEIALALVEDQEVGDIILLRGYPNGHFESSDEAGASRTATDRALRGVEYATTVIDRSRWAAEFKVPFTSLGIAPAKTNPKLLFNLSVRKTADDEWVMWRPSKTYTWQVRKGGFLWLAAFGDVVFNGGVPSQARIDVTSGPDGPTLSALRGCEVATWSKPLGKRLTGSTDDLATTQWQDWEYSFSADADGAVSINLMGRGHYSAIDNSMIPVWVYFDAMGCEGAQLQNGDFEQVDSKGQPAGWKQSLQQAFLIADPAAAASGTRCVKTWHNGRFTQTIEVKQGLPVVIRMKVRGETAQ